MSFKIHWLCHSPSPYNDYLFQSLAADPEIDLLVHFNKRELPSHPWGEPLGRDFPSRYYKKTIGLDWRLITFAMKEKGSIFVLGGWNHPTILAVSSILINRKKPFLVWTDTPNIDPHRLWFKDKLRAKWLKFVFHHAGAVMGTGREAVEVLRKMGCPTEKVVNFPYWVALPENWKNKNNSNRESIKFFAVGQLIKRKGYDLAIRALGKLIESVRGENIEFWVFGDGPERQFLECSSKDMHLSQVVKFFGWREPYFIQKKIKEADVLVHPALWEAYGVAVLEAMALGKPMIASNRTMAAIDRIQDGVNGFIFKNGHIDQLADYMAYFVRNPHEIFRMGEEARQTAEQWPVGRGVEILKKIASRQMIERKDVHEEGQATTVTNPTL